MKRRTLLASIPGVLGLASGGGVGNVSTTATPISIITMDSLHPRVWRSVKDLISDLRELGYSVNVVKGQLEVGNNARRIVVGVTDNGNHRQLQEMGWKSESALLPEHFELTARPGIVFALGADFRAVVYAISELRRRIARKGSLPAAVSVRYKPAFSVRRWSTAVSHNFGSPWDERIHLSGRFSYIKSEVIPRALDYGMSSIELNGRPGDGWDIDWMIGFEKYPELAALFPAGERHQRLLLVEDLARAAHDNLLELLVWSHELHLPTGFTDLYPQVKGKDYPVCLSNVFLKQFIREKYLEFFSAAPSVDGLVISVNESGQFSLLTDAGCKCDRCILMTQRDRLSTVLGEVITVASQLRKQIVLRTFQSSFIHNLDGHPELETIHKAYIGVPKSVRIMSKYCPLDFYGGEIADEPLIGAFPNPHLVEFSLDVEWQGRTFLPVLTPGNFQRRIVHALKKECAGIVARVDFPFPSMEPEPIFNHPNDFNARFMGELLWNPEATIDESLLSWCVLRYGPQSGPLIAPALRKTEEITQKTFFALGQTVINYHNMIAAVSVCDNNLWGHALSKWDPGKAELARSFFEPSDDLITQCMAEKRKAIDLAAEALREIHRTNGKLPQLEYQRLRYMFEKLKDTAELWSHLLEVYLRHRQVASSPPKPELVQIAILSPDQGPLTRLLQAAQATLRKAIEMESLHGVGSWPVVSPDRGVSVYEFANQILRHYMGAISGEPVVEHVTDRHLDYIVSNPVYQHDSVESLWRNLMECGRPGSEVGSSIEVSLRWPGKLRRLAINGSNYTLTGQDGFALSFPLAYPVQAFSLAKSSEVALSIAKDPHHLVVREVRA